MTKGFSIEIKFIVYSTPLRVFDALTQAALIEKWSSGKGKVELKPDGDMESNLPGLKSNTLPFTKFVVIIFCLNICLQNEKKTLL